MPTPAPTTPMGVHAIPPHLPAVHLFATAESPAAAHLRADQYAHHIVMAHVEKEPAFTPPPSLLAGHPELRSRMRAILLDWLFSVSVYAGHAHDTFFCAVSLLDRRLAATKVPTSAPPSPRTSSSRAASPSALAGHNIHAADVGDDDDDDDMAGDARISGARATHRPPSVPRARLQLAGVAALWVASKVHETSPLSLAECVAACDAAFTVDDLLAEERVLLAAVDFRLHPPVPSVFVRRAERVRALCEGLERGAQRGVGNSVFANGGCVGDMGEVSIDGDGGTTDVAGRVAASRGGARSSVALFVALTAAHAVACATMPGSLLALAAVRVGQRAVAWCEGRTSDSQWMDGWEEAVAFYGGGWNEREIGVAEGVVIRLLREAAGGAGEIAGLTGVSRRFANVSVSVFEWVKTM